MKLSKRNSEKVEYLYFFCWLYTKHRDFDLAKRIANSKPLKYGQAEKLSDFCNQLISTKESKPEDFISDEDESNNDVIDKYFALKSSLSQVKKILGAKKKNEIYKSVKLFYKKKVYAYQMDSYYNVLIYGLYGYIKGVISFESFVNDYYYEVSLFTGKRKDIDLKYVIKMSNYILSC